MYIVKFTFFLYAFKYISGNLDPEFVYNRRRGLERFLNRCACHPVFAHSKIFHDFLTCKDEKVEPCNNFILVICQIHRNGKLAQRIRQRSCFHPPFTLL